MIFEKLIVLAARAILGLFLSILTGITLYLLALIAVISIWDVTYVDFAILAIMAIGVGAGVGSFLGWLERERPLSIYTLELLIPITAGLIGAWIGLQRGLEIDALKLVGTPGVPTLSMATIGAVLGANIPPVAIGIIKAVRNPRV